MTSDTKALPYALLGLLSRRSLSGWELGDEHRKVLAEFEAIRAALEARYGGLEETDDVVARRRPGRARAAADAGDFIMTS